VKLSELKKRVNEFADMEPNWDSYGAKPISKDCISKAIELLDKMDKDVPPPFVAPLPSGGIQFEWETESGYMEIVINCFN
jgi:hypothetical protein